MIRKDRFNPVFALFNTFYLIRRSIFAIIKKMGWIYLLLAVGFEVCGTTSMRLSNGLTKLLPSVLIFVFYVLSFIFATMATKYIKLAVMYAIWSGIGIVAITFIDLFLFKEKINTMEIFGLALILAGSIVLRIA